MKQNVLSITESKHNNIYNKNLFQFRFTMIELVVDSDRSKYITKYHGEIILIIAKILNNLSISSNLFKMLKTLKF